MEGEVLLGPAAVLRGLLAQEAALCALFTRDPRQVQRVALVVAHALLHFTLLWKLSRADLHISARTPQPAVFLADGYQREGG